MNSASNSRILILARYLSLSLILTLLFLWHPGIISAQTDLEKIEPLLNKLLQTNKQITGISLDMFMKERFGDTYTTKKASFKIQYSTNSFYVKQHQPDVFEVLYVEGKNNNKAWVRPQTFPWTTVSLSPIAKTMRENNHHSFFKAGFRFFIDILSHLQIKYGNQFYEMISYNGLVKYNNVLCQKITFENPDFKYVNYKTPKELSLEDLSNLLKINDYMVVEKNLGLKSFDRIPAGTSIIVPNDYGKSITVYIEEATGLLAGVKVFDEKGLWEEYTYSAVVINPKFNLSDFDLNNPEYSF